ncbi:hypothetical protein BDR03DRAFT_954037 [Suillus americanus]|nr:hypothetical protein BDR03DRAFT_954037 [Suillus americanus]
MSPLHRVDSQDLLVHQTQPRFSLLASQTRHRFCGGGVVYFQRSARDASLLQVWASLTPGPTGFRSLIRQSSPKSIIIGILHYISTSATVTWSLI